MDDVTPVAASSPRLVDVRPMPTDDELAAVMAAVEVLWPRAVLLSADPSVPAAWRFSGRWWSKPLPLRRSRP